jgi:hypothetical protein
VLAASGLQMTLPPWLAFGPAAIALVIARAVNILG